MTKATKTAITFSLIMGLGVALIMWAAQDYIVVEKHLAKTIKVTAYRPCEKCCGKWADGQTASGYWIQLGDRFVAAPKHIPFGTMFIVPGYNNDEPVEVKDRGGAITVSRLDVYFDTHQEALNWGVKYLAIRAIEGR